MNTNNAYLEAVDSLIDQLEVKKKESPESFNLKNTEQLFRAVAAQFIELDIDREVFLDFANLFDGDYTDDAAARLFASLLAEMENKEPENPQKVLARFRELCRTMFGVREAKKQSVLIDGLPPFAVEIAQHIATVRQLPIDFVVGSIYSATAMLAGNRWRLFDGKYYNYPQLWLCLIAPAGDGKSPAMSEIFEPIRERDKSFDHDYSLDLESWEREGKKQQEPRRKRYSCDDSTPEVRDRLLFQTGGSVSIKVDEIKTLIGNIGRYTKSGELSRLLSIYSNDSYSVDRVGSPSLHIARPVLSILGGIQDDMIVPVFGNPDFQGCGFLPRWIWIWNENPDYPPRNGLRLSPDIMGKWREFVGYFDGIDTVTNLGLTKQAEAIYTKFFNRLQALKRDSGAGYEREVYAKAQINAERWGLVLHILKSYQDHLNNDFPSDNLGADTMGAAIRHMEAYFIPTALKVAERLQNAPRYDLANITRAQAIRALASVYPELCRADLARAIGKDPSYITKILNHK
jgi:hypothetical protein